MACFGRAYSGRKSDSNLIQGDLRMQLFTWNVGNEVPTENMEELFGELDGSVDLYVIGLQESSYTGSSTVVRDAIKSRPKLRKALRKHTDIVQRILVYFGDAYACLKVVELGFEMKMCVLRRVACAATMTVLHHGVERTGILGVASNKGGKAVVLQVEHVLVGLVSAHLAAHEGPEYRTRRNQDVSDILRGTGVVSKHERAARLDLLSTCHHVFWMGDLNYRMDLTQLEGGERWAGASHEEKWAKVDELVRAEAWDELLRADELREQIRLKRALTGFREGDMAFAPTFKVEKGTAGTTYLPQRVPAYCDRILWRSLPGLADDVEQTVLESLPQVSSSDHKPVRARFRLRLRTLVPPRSERMSGKQRRTRGATLHVRNLAVRDLPAMDTDHAADPFVVFTSEVLFGRKVQFRTPTKPHTTEAAWDDAEVPPMGAQYRRLESIRRCFLNVLVMDEDTLSQNDTVGHAIIPLAALTERDGSLVVAARDVDILKYGQHRGFLSCDIHVDLKVSSEV